MARETMEFLSPWEAIDEDGDGVLTNRLRVLRDHIEGVPNCQVTDITGTPEVRIQPDPNSSVCRITADTTVLDAIEADPNYPVMVGTRQVL